MKNFTFEANNAPIGVYDSGIGGLSVLRALVAELPHERFVYFADDAWAPYGERERPWVAARALEVAAELIEGCGVKALVVACNTATAAGAASLRLRWPTIPIVGVEPALKPALAATRSGGVAVLATRGTLESPKFAALKGAVQAEAAADARIAAAGGLRLVTRACDGLAAAIESGDTRAIDTSLDRHLAACGPFAARGAPPNAIDTIVLGCTHYPLVADRIAAWLQASGPRAVTVIESGAPVARQLRRKLVEARLASRPGDAPAFPAPAVRFAASRDASRLDAAAAQWLDAKALGAATDCR